MQLNSRRAFISTGVLAWLLAVPPGLISQLHGQNEPPQGTPAPARSGAAVSAQELANQVNNKVVRIGKQPVSLSFEAGGAVARPAGTPNPGWIFGFEFSPIFNFHLGPGQKIKVRGKR